MNARVTRKRGKLRFLLLQIVLAYAFSLTCMPVSVARIQNDTLKLAVITDTKFYFPSFFEQNQQQRGGAEKEAFRHMPFIPVARWAYRDEVKFDFLPSCANIDVSRRFRSLPASVRVRSRVVGEKHVSVSRFNAFLQIFGTTNIDAVFYLEFSRKS